MNNKKVINSIIRSEGGIYMGLDDLIHVIIISDLNVFEGDNKYI